MTMKVLLRSEICQRAPERWAQQYRNTSDEHKARITERLLALSPQDRTPEKIDEIIGNTSWTRNVCDECGENHDLLIMIGEEPDYDARWVELCAGCLLAAAKVLEQTAAK